MLQTMMSAFARVLQKNKSCRLQFTDHRSRGLYRKTRGRVNESLTSVKSNTPERSIPSSNSRAKRLAEMKSPAAPPVEHAMKQELIDASESSTAQSGGLLGELGSEEQDSSVHLQIDEDRSDVDDDGNFSTQPQLTNVSRGGDDASALPVGEDEDDEQRMIDEDMAAYYLQSDDDQDSLGRSFYLSSLNEF
jgi:hypothetical protein